MNIYRLVADIIVAADDEMRQLRPHLVNILQKISQPCHFKVLPQIAARAGGHVYIYDGKIVEIGAQHAAFVIVKGMATAYGYVFRFLLRKYTYPAVAFFTAG